MLYKKNSLFLLTILLIPSFIFSAPETLPVRCRRALQEDISNPAARQSVIHLVKEIESREKLYLKSGLYRDVRRYYAELQATLGDYYFNQKDFSKALDCYQKADQYSDIGYSEKIAACKKKLPQKQKVEIPKVEKKEIKPTVAEKTKKEEWFKKSPQMPIQKKEKDTEPEPITPPKKIAPPIPETGSQQEDILNFLEIMSKFTRASKADDPVWGDICNRLVKAGLNGGVFNDLKMTYKGLVPGDYDFLMNLFFHVIYHRRNGWEEAAEMIIKEAGWKKSIKIKMNRIFFNTTVRGRRR